MEKEEFEILTTEQTTEEPKKEEDVKEVQEDVKKSTEEPKKEEQAEEPKKEAPKKDDKPKRKSRSQKRIERLARDKKELEERLKKLETQIPQKVDEPSVDDYDDYEDYAKAVEEFEKKQTIESVEPITDKRQDDLFEDGKEIADDFEEKVKNENLPLTQTLLENIYETDSPADLVYHLANDIELTAKLAGMSEKRQAIELGKTEAKLATKQEPPKKQQSKAPEPITPENGSGGNDVKTLGDDLPFEEHEKLLLAQRKTGSDFL